jgi:hypothetical protein
LCCCCGGGGGFLKLPELPKRGILRLLLRRRLLRLLLLLWVNPHLVEAQVEAQSKD